MTINPALYSTGQTEHETPPDLFEELDQEFRFDLDACATPDNCKVQNYYSKAQDGLSQDWHGNVFINPPYGREIGKWVKKAKYEVLCGNAKIAVMLLPARTDTKWFHDSIWDLKNHRPQAGVKIRLLKGRIRFKGTKHSAPFPSMIVIFFRK